MKQYDRISITDKMITKARQEWPDTIDFDFVECMSPSCPFIGLVQLGEERCPDCGQDMLQWADAAQQEYSL